MRAYVSEFELLPLLLIIDPVDDSVVFVKLGFPLQLIDRRLKK